MQLPQAIVEQKKRTDALIADQKARLDARLTPAAPEVNLEEIVPPIEAPAPSIDWEHKFKTIEGMWKAEKRQWQEKMDGVMSELGQLRAAAKAINDSKPILDLKSILTQDEIDGRDEAELSVLARVGEEAARKAHAKAREDLQSELEPLRQQVEQTKVTAAQRAQETFWTTLASLCPDWEKINEDARWKAWLAQTDKLSKRTRQSILDSHSNSQDAHAVAEVFEAFRETLPLPQRRNSVVPEPVVPAPTSSPSKEYYKNSEVRQFYSALARGDYKSRPTEGKEIKAKIDLAYLEGRILPG